MALKSLPSHLDVKEFFQTQLPVAVGAKEVSFIYHAPRYRAYSAETYICHRVVLSITPTQGFHAACNDVSSVCFLHRPWSLDRHRVRADTLVLASHAAFDSALTVGWNVALARRLLIDTNTAVCLSGYKNNPDRKIGLVGKLSRPTRLAELTEILRKEFRSGELHLPLSSSPLNDDHTVDAVAIMNAFHAEEVHRVLAISGVTTDSPATNGSKTLYLTGAAREHGLEAAATVKMPAFCVGHRACEEWGIRYLAEQVRHTFPGLEVIEVLEEEEEQSNKNGDKNQIDTSVTTKSVYCDSSSKPDLV